MRFSRKRLSQLRWKYWHLDSTSCKLHPDAHGALKTRTAIYRKIKGRWNTKLHVVSANDKIIVEMHLSGGNCHDAPQGRVSIEQIGNRYSGVPILMDRAYEGNKTIELCRSLGHEPVVPPKKNRLDPWEYDHEFYKQRNIIERLFRWLKEFQRVCTRYDKRDLIFFSFVQIACIFM